MSPDDTFSVGYIGYLSGYVNVVDDYLQNQTSSRDLKSSDEVCVKSWESQKLKPKIKSEDTLESQKSRKSKKKPIIIK